jgi:hypothetical protein
LLAVTNGKDQGRSDNRANAWDLLQPSSRAIAIRQLQNFFIHFTGLIIQRD